MDRSKYGLSGYEPWEIFKNRRDVVCSVIQSYLTKIDGTLKAKEALELYAKDQRDIAEDILNQLQKFDDLSKDSLELYAYQYMNEYEIKHGTKPDTIHLSKKMLQEYEKKHEIYKLERICGMKVLSPDYPAKYE